MVFKESVERAEVEEQAEARSWSLFYAISGKYCHACYHLEKSFSGLRRRQAWSREKSLKVIFLQLRHKCAQDLGVSGRNRVTC